MNVRNIIEQFGTVLNFIKCLVLGKRGTSTKVMPTDTLTILANGPSLKNIIKPPYSFDGQTMVVNHFFKSEYFHLLQPDYYVICAPEFWTPIDDIKYIKMQKALLNSFEKVNWDLVFYIPYKADKHDFKEKIGKINPKIIVRYFNDTGLDSWNLLDKIAMKKKLGMPRPHNVLIPSLMLGIWMEYKTINVYGADHSWLPMIKVLPNNLTVISQNHFYDKADVKHEPMRKLGIGQRKLHEILEKFYFAFKAYHFIQAFALKKNTRIINHTKDSFIDAFERVESEG